MPQQKETLQDIALRELAWYRVLTLRQILLLSGCTSERWAREQLHSLAEKEYLYIRTPHLSKGRLPRVYQLLPKGKTYLKKRGVDVPYSVLSLKDLEEAEEKKIFPDHTLGVNDVFIMLHVLTVHYPDRFQLLTRIHEREMSQYVTRRDGGVEPVLPHIWGTDKLILPTGSFFPAQNTCPSRHYGRAFPKCEDDPLSS